MPGTTTPDKIQLQVVIDGSPARKELAELVQSSVKLKQEQQALRVEERRLMEQRNAARKLGDTAAAARYADALQKVRQAGGQLSKSLEENIAKQKESRASMGLMDMGLGELRRHYRELQAVFNAGLGNKEELLATAQRMELVETRIKALGTTQGRSRILWEQMRGSIKLTDMTMEQLEQESQRLKMVLDQTKPNTAEFRALHGELGSVDRRMKELRTGMGPFGQAWQMIKGQILSATAVVGTFFAGGALIQGFKGYVRSAAEFSDTLADVRRTTGLGQKDVEDLARSFGSFNTRTPRKELLELAATAGKLGITGTQDIREFVKAGDQIRVALGEDLGEEAIKQIAKLNLTFKVAEDNGKSLGANLLATGSAINALGQSGTEAEAFLVDYATRMAGVNVQAKINIQDTLGFAAALDELGQRSETSSTAVSQFTLKAFKDTATYAQIAGMSVQEFKKLLGEDANEALLRTLEGLRGNNEGLGRMTELFADMGQEGARAVGVLSSLANNTDLIRDRQGKANAELRAGTSITTEFNTKNSTLAANLDIIGKRLAGAFVNSGVVNGINRIVRGLREWISVPVSQTLEQERVEMMKLHAQILSTNKGSEERITLIKELQSRYPQYLGQLDADKVSNQQLGMAIRAMNEQLVNKIILQKQSEKLQQQIESQADVQMTVLEHEDKVRTAMVKMAEKHKMQLAEELPLAEQARKLYTDIAEQRRRAGQMQGGLLTDDLARYGKQVRTLEVQLSVLNSEQNVTNRLTEERADLMKRLGIETEQVANAAGEAESDHAADLRKVNEEIAAMQRELKRAGGNEEEVAMVQAKIDALVARKSFLEKALLAVDPAQVTEAVQRTLDVIDKEISAAKERQEVESTVDNKAYGRIEKEIKALEKERRRITGETQESSRDQLAEHLAKLEAEMAAMRERVRQSSLSDDDRELAQMDEKHKLKVLKVREQQKELIKAKRLTPEQAETDIKGLKGSQGDERADLIERQGERRMQAMRESNARIQQALGEGHNAHLQAEVQHWESILAEQREKGGRIRIEDIHRLHNAEITLYVQNGLDLLKAEEEKWDKIIAEARERARQYQEAIDATGVEPSEEVVQELRDLNDQIISAEDAKNQAIEDMNRAHREHEKAERKKESAEIRSEFARRVQQVAEFGNATSNVLGGIIALKDAEINIAENRANAAAQRRKEAAELAGLDDELVEQAAQRTAQEEQEIERLKASRRRAALANIAAQAGSAIASGVASAMMLPFPANLVSAAATIGTVLGFIAQARALVAEGEAASGNSGGQQGQRGPRNIPRGAEGLQAQGSRVLTARDGGGVLGGSRHGQGNANRLIDTNTGQALAEVERDELMLIMSRRATAANADLIPALLEASRRGERFTPFRSELPMPNPQRVGQAMRVAHMAAGGSYPVTPTAGQGSAASVEMLLHQLIAETRGTRRAAESFPVSLNARVSNVDFDRRRSEYDYIKARNRASRKAG